MLGRFVRFINAVTIIHRNSGLHVLNEVKQNTMQNITMQQLIPYIGLR